MPRLDIDDNVYVLNLGDDENRFTPDWIGSVRGLLTEVAEADESRALVTTADGKFWSNGIDLAWLAEHLDQLDDFVEQIHGMFSQMLALPVPTIAAIQGHVFAGGAMLALAHDLRIMRADRGFFCLPEVDIRIPFTPGMGALIQAKLTPAAANAAMTTGARYGGGDALRLGLVDATAEEGQVLASALERIRPFAGKDRPTLGTIKQRMYASAIAVLGDRAANSSAIGFDRANP
ncbi:MAG: enoyl-CoA hydratase-related protein [Actinomycetota bacterium]